MHRPLIKHITTFLFLVTFLLPRVADLHAFEHLSEDNNPISCELCDITIHTQQFDLFVGEIPYDEGSLLNIPSVNVVYGFYDIPLDKIVSPTSVYNKPPPSS